MVKGDVSSAVGPTPLPGAPANKAAAAGHELAQNGGTAEHPAPALEAPAPSADVTAPAAAEPAAAPLRQAASADSTKAPEPNNHSPEDTVAQPTPPRGIVASAAASPKPPAAGTTAAPSEAETAPSAAEAMSSVDAEVKAEAHAEAPAPTPKGDSRALSTFSAASAASSAYYSASSWSQLGPDGEWPGPSLDPPASAESFGNRLAHTVSTSSREGPGPVDPQAGAASVGGQGHSGTGSTPGSGVLPSTTATRVEEGPQQPGPWSGSRHGSPQELQPQGRAKEPYHEHQQHHGHHHHFQHHSHQHQERQLPQPEHLPVLAEEGAPSERGEAALPEAQAQQQQPPPLEQQPPPLEQPPGTGLPDPPPAQVTAESASPPCPPAAGTAAAAGAAAGASEGQATGDDAGPPGAATPAAVVLPPLPEGGTPARCSRGAAAAGDEAAADEGSSDNKARGGSGGGSREAMLDQVAELYGLRGMPCRACQAMLNYCKVQDVVPESLQPELHARQLPDAEALTKVVQDVYDSLADMASDSGWHVVRNDELKLMYKHLPAKGVHAFRARCVLDAPTEHLVALAREVDLCPTWNRYCTSASVLRQMSLTDVLVYISLWMPWPFNSVGFLLEAFGADLYDEEGCLHITLNTRDKQGNPVTLPAGAAKHRQLKMLRPSCLSITPLPPKVPGGPARTSCTIQAYVDPGTRAVPSFIISFVLKVFSPFVYGAVKKVLATAFGAPHNPLPTRIRERPELYDLIRERTEVYLRTKETAVPATATAGALAGTSSGRTSA